MKKENKINQLEIDTKESNHKISFSAMFAKKNFSLNYKENISIESSLKEITNILFNHFLSRPYPNGEPRLHHGMSHSIRCIVGMIAIANLFRKNQYPDALHLTVIQLKYAIIAMFLHDSAREDDGEDKWDAESAAVTYHCLVYLFKLDKKIAKEYAEAVINKDYDPKKEFLTLVEDQNPDIIYWKKDPKKSKNFLCALVGEGDTLDILRARREFKIRYSSFYQFIVKEDLKRSDQDSLNDLYEVITQHNSLIDLMGDTIEHPKPHIQKYYNGLNAYANMLKLIRAEKYSHLLISEGQFFIDDQKIKKKPIALPNTTSILNPICWRRAMNGNLEFPIFLRGVTHPSAFTQKKHKNGSYTLVNAVETEIKKANRPLGNPKRSMSLALKGVKPFSKTGFILSEVKIDQFFTKDIGSGTGKKNIMDDRIELIDKEFKEYKASSYEELIFKRKFRFYPIYSQTEVIATIGLSNFIGIYYSGDEGLGWEEHYSNFVPSTLLAFLEAVYIYYLYRNSKGVELPIIEYSGAHYHRPFQIIEKLTEEEIVKSWETALKFYLLGSSDISSYSNAPTLCKINAEFEKKVTIPLEELKIKMFYSKSHLISYNDLAYDLCPLDYSYPQKLKEKIDSTLNDLKQHIFIKIYNGWQRLLGFNNDKIQFNQDDDFQEKIEISRRHRLKLFFKNFTSESNFNKDPLFVYLTLPFKNSNSTASLEIYSYHNLNFFSENNIWTRQITLTDKSLLKLMNPLSSLKIKTRSSYNHLKLPIKVSDSKLCYDLKGTAYLSSTYDENALIRCQIDSYLIFQFRELLLSRLINAFCQALNIYSIAPEYNIAKLKNRANQVLYHAIVSEDIKGRTFSAKKIENIKYVLPNLIRVFAILSCFGYIDVNINNFIFNAQDKVFSLDFSDANVQYVNNKNNSLLYFLGQQLGQQPLFFTNKIFMNALLDHYNFCHSIWSKTRSQFVEWCIKEDRNILGIIKDLLPVLGKQVINLVELLRENQCNVFKELHPLAPLPISTNSAKEDIQSFLEVQLLQDILKVDFENTQQYIKRWLKLDNEERVITYLTTVQRLIITGLSLIANIQNLTLEQSIKLISLWKSARRTDIKDYFKKKLNQAVTDFKPTSLAVHQTSLDTLEWEIIKKYWEYIFEDFSEIKEYAETLPGKSSDEKSNLPALIDFKELGQGIKAAEELLYTDQSQSKTFYIHTLSLWKTAKKVNITTSQQFPVNGN